jgi:hypothetical protein
MDPPSRGSVCCSYLVDPIYGDVHQPNGLLVRGSTIDPARRGLRLSKNLENQDIGGFVNTVGPEGSLALPTQAATGHYLTDPELPVQPPKYQ